MLMKKSLEIAHFYTVQISQVSVDYLTKPIEVFKEMCRVLKPGGLAILRWSFCPFYNNDYFKHLWSCATDFTKLSIDVLKDFKNLSFISIFIYTVILQFFF